MADFQRKAYDTLLRWKQHSGRKPMLLGGARQVGKTTLVNMFAREFAAFLSVNLEIAEDREIFERTDSVRDILDAIHLSRNVASSAGDTLLFIDEIQESPKAIGLLRYFYEQFPHVHVIAAGSLLEFSLKNVPSFPVGRLEYLCLHPLDFEEYLTALNYNAASAQLNTLPVREFAHETLLNLFHDYAIIGGMPEVIRRYADSKSMAAALPLYGQLWQSYKDDVEKYAKNSTERNVIRHIIDVAPKVTDRIKFEGFGNSNYKSREVGEAMRTLEMARIVQLVYPTTSLAPPIFTDLRKRPRLQILDSGLLNYSAGLQGQMVGLKDLSDFYRGKIVQHVVGQQLIAIHGDPSYKLHFWVRESPQSNAEVDLIFEYERYLIPIEIKSGDEGRLRSLHQFVDRCDHPYAVRMFAGRLSVEQSRTPAGKDFLLLNLPYYLATKIPDYIKWFCENHRL